MSGRPELAVILAAGRGTRMMTEAAAAQGLIAAQRDAAAQGHKALMPIGGRPFLAWVVDAVARAGFHEVCLVMAPEAAIPRALSLPARIAVQSTPRGTADAVLAAESVVGSRPFTVINGDNWYPPDALRALREVPAPATIGFRQAERVEAFALMTTDEAGCLAEIIEKPEATTRRRLGPTARVSMTCWSFTSAIFDACRAIAPSTRGELELPDAVRLLVREGTCVRVLAHDGMVLDLSRADDVTVVATQLGA